MLSVKRRNNVDERFTQHLLLPGLSGKHLGAKLRRKGTKLGMRY
jgi:hypothetical protein